MILDASSTDDSPVGGGVEPSPVAAAVATAESVLAHRFGSSIPLAEPEDLAGSGPATVVRARVASSAFALPRTLVIKHYPEEPDGGWPDSFAREAATYQLFTALPPEDRVCPELLAHDGDKRILVLDDLGRAPTLEDKLRGSDARAAETALLSWARALGRMHASTAGREPDFDALLRRLSRARGDEAGPDHDGDDMVPLAAVAELPALLHGSFGVSTPDTVLDTVERAAEGSRSATYRAFSPVDLWPDNNLITDAGVRFLDFEHGRIRNALADVAHLWAPFASSPQPLALPGGLSEAMTAAWRAEVVELWPGLADDERLSSFTLNAQLVLVWVSTWRDLPNLGDARGAGPASRAAALVSWWRDLAGRAELAGEQAVADHAAAVSAALDARLGPGLELALYPAFR
ncbi:phosphotransferase [Saccharomonospora piscinae]|uniref:Phosphotransferase n=1 Tax=Saccharomonospora piscinae TaxID=687388 RepID=A0A1V9ACR4_SACPI|nr:phosphotransferase [Saccharomonospora piscinae]OQO94919.1 phosphotransferase [Saccharomonospora piscinae]TLW94363.1 phosphotransferase [Saccharomonospora piscinae]